MRVVGVQIELAWEDKPANFAAVRRWLNDDRVPPGSLVVLPEMFATGFSMNVDRVVETNDGPTFRFLEQLAVERQVHLLAGVGTRRTDGRARNEALLFDPRGTLVTRYVKQQPFTLGGERDHYVAGETCVLGTVEGFCVAPLICYDLRFPELFRSAAFAGAELLAVIANWPLPRDAHWQALLKARAIENQAYVIGVNRCGNDPRLSYRGQSAIYDPQGNLLAAADEAEQLLVADLDRKSLLDYRRKFPALADINPRHFSSFIS